MDTQKIDAIIKKYGCNPEYANEMLIDVQAEFDLLPEDVLRYIGDELLIPQGRLYHIATFYPTFKLSKDDQNPEKDFRKFMGEQDLKYLPGPDGSTKIVTGNFGKSGEFKALEKALKMKPAEVIAEVKKSGLVGRCGFGKLTGDKWQKCADNAKNGDAYVICNIDEGVPRCAAYKSLAESDPHSIIEGMIIGAYAIGASEGIISIRNCYSKAIETITKAVDAAYKKGYLGENILNSGFTFNIKIRRSPGALMNFDLSALVESLSGRPGEPSGNYIKLHEKGYNGKPTLLSCVETWANIPFIIGNGADSFAKIGKNGTKLVTLVGDVNNTGFAEVPLGMTLQEIIDTFGGGSKGAIKAVQVGGPSGAFFPPDKLNTPLDYETFKNAGQIIGTGMIRVIGENGCFFCALKDSLEFLKDESFGKSVVDREGVTVMYSIIEKIDDNKACPDDIDILKSVAETMAATSLSNLGKQTAKMVLSAIEQFRGKIEKKIENKKCS